MARGPRKTQSNQEARDAIARTISRDRYASDVNARVLRLLLDLERDTVAKLADFDPSDGKRVRERLEKLKKEVADEITARYDRVRKEATGELPKLAENEARWKEASLQRSVDGTGADITIALAPNSVLEALVDQPVVLGAVAADFWKAEGQALSDNFARQMQIGVASGENIGQLIARVKGTRAKNYSDGIMAVSRRNAESLVRTSVTSVANEAQMAVFRQNADVVEGLQHVAVLDSRTTLICSGRHGLTWRLDNFDPVNHATPFRQPALHWRCRSIISSVLDLENPPALSPDFKTYFDGMPPEEQGKVFGVGRAALFREGRISQKDLLSTNGSPLSLEQLVDQHGPPSGSKGPNLKEMLDKDWGSVTMEDVLTNREFVLAERRALAMKQTIEDEDNFPVDYFSTRRYAKIDPKVGKPTPGDPYETNINETLSNIRKRGEHFAGPEGPLFERKATIVIGPPAAGKSTLAEALSVKTRSAIVDVDEAKWFMKENNGGLGASAVHNESAILTKKAFKNVYAEGMNVVLPKVGGSVKSIEKAIRELKEAGYDVDIVNLAVTQNEAARRMGARFVHTGRLIPSEFYRSIGDAPTKTYNVVKKSRDVRSYAEVDVNGSQGEEKITEGGGAVLEWLRKIYGG